MKMMILAAVGLAAGALVAEVSKLDSRIADVRPDREAPTVMNIVNFVRGSEPRNSKLDLVLPLREEIALNTRYHLKNTILLQYDALLRDDIMAVARSAEAELTEYGVWIEVGRERIKKVGLGWGGGEGWQLQLCFDP